MALDQWHWGLLWPWGQAGMPLRGTAETRAEAMGPWAYNVGVMKLWGRSFIRTK